MTKKLSALDRAVLQKLVSKRAFPGKRHYGLKTLVHSGWKSHERGRVKQSIEKLIRMGLVGWKKRDKKAIQLTKEGLDYVAR